MTMHSICSMENRILQRMRCLKKYEVRWMRKPGGIFRKRTVHIKNRRIVREIPLKSGILFSILSFIFCLPQSDSDPYKHLSHCPVCPGIIGNEFQCLRFKFSTCVCFVKCLFIPLFLRETFSLCGQGHNTL